MDMNKWFFKLLNIDTKIVYSSELCDNDLRGLDKIIYILNKINTTRYITSNGPGASRYIDENVFKNNKIPFRSFEVFNRNEQTLGEIFCFFILETILLGRALKVNPFDQPSVELIKKETKKILLKN